MLNLPNKKHNHYIRIFYFSCILLVYLGCTFLHFSMIFCLHIKNKNKKGNNCQCTIKLANISVAILKYHSCHMYNHFSTLQALLAQESPHGPLMDFPKSYLNTLGLFGEVMRTVLHFRKSFEKGKNGELIVRAIAPPI
jgi:hypothetical protein